MEAAPTETPLIGPNRQGTVRSFTTQNDGVFSFTTLEAATYSISVATSSGFADWREPVTLDVGQSRNIRFSSWSPERAAR